MLSASQLQAIRQFDTCAIANAIESFEIRLRNEGFTRPGLRCLSGDNARLIGYATTCRVRSENPPVKGRSYFDRMDWWEAMERIPQPRIAVLEDLDPVPAGAFVGEVHAAVLKAFGCQGVITNGAVRDLDAVRALGLSLFAAHAGVSHAYVHMVDYGTPVKIFGLRVHPGDLLYADCHGAVSIPHEIAGEVAGAAARIRDAERRIVNTCLSPDFSPEHLIKAIRSNQ